MIHQSNPNADECLLCFNSITITPMMPTIVPLRVTYLMIPNHIPPFCPTMLYGYMLNVTPDLIFLPGMPLFWLTKTKDKKLARTMAET